MRWLAGVAAVRVSVEADGALNLRADGLADPGQPVLAFLHPQNSWVTAEMCEDSPLQVCKHVCDPQCPTKAAGDEPHCATRVGDCCEVQLPCKDGSQLLEAAPCPGSAPAPEGSNCPPHLCEADHCAVRVGDCGHECQVPSHLAVAPTCNGAAAQTCRMACPQKLCAPDLCAMRVDDCCEFSCEQETDPAPNSNLVVPDSVPDPTQPPLAPKAERGVASGDVDEEAELRKAGVVNVDSMSKDEMHAELQALRDGWDAQVAKRTAEVSMRNTMKEADRRHEDWKDSQDSNPVNVSEGIAQIGRESGAKSPAKERWCTDKDPKIEAMNLTFLQEHTCPEAVQLFHDEHFNCSTDLGAIEHTEQHKMAHLEGETLWDLCCETCRTTTYTATYPPDLQWRAWKRHRRDVNPPGVENVWIPTPTQIAEGATDTTGKDIRRRRRQIGGQEIFGYQVADKGEAWDGAAGSEGLDAAHAAAQHAAKAAEHAAHAAADAAAADAEPATTADAAPDAADGAPDAPAG